MHYITVAEYESPGTVTCKIQGLHEETSRELATYLRKRNMTSSTVNNIIFSDHEHKDFFEIDTQGVQVLNLLIIFYYRVISQSTVIEVSNIGGRTDKVQKTIWTLVKE